MVRARRFCALMYDNAYALTVCTVCPTRIRPLHRWAPKYHQRH
jgi:hypothetical protein